MALKSTGISIPEEVLNELDVVAKSWFTDRSKAIVRIFIEWKQLQNEPPENNLKARPDAKNLKTETETELTLAA